MTKAKMLLPFIHQKLRPQKLQINRASATHLSLMLQLQNIYFSCIKPVSMIMASHL